MKGSSIATVVFVATLTTIITALVVNALLGDPNERKETISYMDVISADIIEPDTEVFNLEAVNPTVEVYVGNCKEGEVWSDEKQICEVVEGSDPDNPDNPNPEE